MVVFQCQHRNLHHMNVNDENGLLLQCRACTNLQQTIQ